MDRPIVNSSTQHNRITNLIDEDGTFDATGLENFMDMIKLGLCGRSYAVVSIMGPQSSGKSTLLNHLFGTNFAQMDASRGRPKTTKGVWLSNAVGMERLTIVMDLEGNDGRERGEDVAFEKKIALFALAVSDVMLINMWSTDVGREQGANKPLLRTIFEVYITKLFRPGKATLVFVIRDKDKVQTPVELLEAIIREDVRKIWEEDVTKPKEHNTTPLSEFFNVKFVALPCPLFMKDQFETEVASLKQQLCDPIECGGLAAVQRRVPASEFLFSCQQIWKSIQENKDLDLPKHKDLVAYKRCDEIVSEICSAFLESKEWCQLNYLVQSGPVPGFRKRLLTMMGESYERYELETTYFDERIRSTKKKELVKGLLPHIKLAAEKLLGSIKYRAFVKFIEELHNAVNRGESRDSAAESSRRLLMAQFNTELEEVGIALTELEISKVREELQSDIDAHIKAFCHGLPPPECETEEPKKTGKKWSQFWRIVRALCLSILSLFFDFDWVSALFDWIYG